MDDKSAKDVALNMRLPADLLEKAKAQAEERGVSVAAMIRMLLERPIIGLFYHQPNNAPVWLLLPATSQYISDMKIIPESGDRISLLKADRQLIIGDEDGLYLPIDFYKTVVTVTERIYGYMHYDIAMLCEYKPF